MTHKGQKVQLHPLVVMQMSEHYSRFKVQQGKNVKEVYGAILGKQVNRQNEAINSFQLKIDYDSDGLMIDSFDETHSLERAEQYLEVFPELQIIGMYCCGETDGLSGYEKEVLLRMIFTLRANSEKSTHIISPLILKMNAATAGQCRTLPLAAFECDFVDIERISQQEWILVSEESERIGVNHIAKLSTQDGKASGGTAADEKHAKAQAAAMDMLCNRVELICAYFERVQRGEIAPDHAILKEANLLAQRLKTVDRYAEEMGEDFIKEEKMIGIFQLLPKITKLVGNMAHVWAKVSGNRHEIAVIDEANARVASHSRWAATRRVPVTVIPTRSNSSNPFDDVPDNDEFLDEEDELENGAVLKRKITADSQGNLVAVGGGGSAAQQRKERRGRRQEKIPRGLASSSSSGSNQHMPSTSNNSNDQSMIDQEMEATAWVAEQLRNAARPGIPDAPMPSVSNSASTAGDDLLDEPI